MKAKQIDIFNNITEIEEEPTGPSQNRIKEIICNSLNQGGYTFRWEQPLQGQTRRQPLHGILDDGSITIDLLIYVWRISNEGDGRVDLSGKRIQIGRVDEAGFQRPITNTEKTLLLGVYERDYGYPIIAAWDVERNREHGSSKSCFVKISDFAEARKNGIFHTRDSAGNPVFAMTPDYLTAYIEQIQANATLNWYAHSIPPTKPSSFSKRVQEVAYERAVNSTETILKRLQNLSESEKQVVVSQRIGQGSFKKLLMEKYNKKCCICGFDFPPLLVGSHIKPWSQSNTRERLDPNNGLLLCVLHDALFDKYLISFDENGEIVFADSLSKRVLEFSALESNITIHITGNMKPYIAWHFNKLISDQEY
jgi:hypothetical protein